MPSWRRSVDAKPTHHPSAPSRHFLCSPKRGATRSTEAGVCEPRYHRPGQLALGLDQLLPPASLEGVTDAAELLADAIEGEARVLIVGDFDADGATSCAMAVSVLQQMGLREVAYLVPTALSLATD